VNGKGRAILLVALGLLVAAVCSALALREVDFTKLGATLRGADWRLSVPFLLALFSSYWVRAVRWAQLLRPMYAVRANELFAPVMIGYAGNALLPLQLGDLARAAMVARQAQRPLLAVLLSLAIERALDLAGIVIVLIVVLWWSAQLPPIVANAGYGLSAVIMIALALALSYVFWTSIWVRLAEIATGWLPTRLATRLVEQVRGGAQGLAVLRNPRLTGAAIVASVVQWLFMCICVWLSLVAVHVNAPAVAALVALVLTVISISVPSSPGYFGNIQLAYVLALKPFGVTPEAALAASLFFHVLAYPAVIIVGLAFLRRTGLGLMALRPRSM
jgi:uncharacterized protein (TIRG00374 family)